MKVLISILIVLVVIFTGYRLIVYWEEVENKKDLEKKAASAQINPRTLDGLSSRFENSLSEAKSKGAAQFGDWIEQAKQASIAKDPRLAWIELDYVLMVVLEDPVKAKKVFLDVQGRTPENSPVYKRVQSMKKTFE